MKTLLWILTYGKFKFFFQVEVSLAARKHFNVGYPESGPSKVDTSRAVYRERNMMKMDAWGKTGSISSDWVKKERNKSRQ